MFLAASLQQGGVAAQPKGLPVKMVALAARRDGQAERQERALPAKAIIARFRQAARMLVVAAAEREQLVTPHRELLAAREGLDHLHRFQAPR